MNADNYRRGYIKGFEKQMVKSGFLQYLANRLIAKEALNRVSEASSEQEPSLRMKQPTDMEMADAPKKLATDVPQPDQVGRRAARLQDHQKVDLRAQRLGEEVGRALPEELREELKRTGQLQRIAQNIARKRNASSKSSKRLLRH